MRSLKRTGAYAPVVLTVPLVLATSSLVAAGDGALLEATGAWVRPARVTGGGHAHAGTPSLTAVTSAVYMTLVNHGSHPVRIVGASTPVADGAELHETRIE
ncbi:MAG: copper chaperone PCu(A)C, partial [Firmicutes bacterium]|nr:copper chaperone PCu(A)C [Bacillota bacterium]